MSSADSAAPSSGRRRAPAASTVDAAAPGQRSSSRATRYAGRSGALALIPVVKSGSAAPKASRINGGALRGRRRKGYKKDGTIKLSSTVERVTADAGCRLFDIGLQLLSSQHEAARQHACKRAHMRASLQRSVVPQQYRPPTHHSRWRTWLRSAVSSTEDSDGVKAARPLVMARTLLYGCQLSPECEALAKLWVAHWASEKVQTTFCCARGFGLQATKQLATGQVVARGLLEKDFDEPCYTVLGGGTMYGPAAMVNAACSEACANAVFRAEAGQWRVEVKSVIRAGEEVLVHYPACGECACGAREWQ